MAPEDLVKFLNEYLTAMTDIIHRLKGTIDKYEGDAIIAFWNAPLETENHAGLAVQAAIECQAVLSRMRPRFRKTTGKEVRMRIGINSGPAVVGNLGSNTRFDYTMIGDAVNLAARLESGNKHFNTYTMVSEETKDLAGPGLLYRNLGRITVKGREKPVRVYQPLGRSDKGPGLVQPEVVNLFEQGLALFEAGAFYKAGRIFGEISDIDPPAAVYKDLCHKYEKSPPRDWAGIFPFSSK
jgi:adenylate cyclase